MTLVHSGQGASIPSVLERMARAICRKYHEGCGFPPEDAEAEADSTWLDWRGEARAALEVMREPSDAIVDFGTGCIGWRREFPTATAHAQMRDAFNEMIDAILSGEA